APGRHVVDARTVPANLVEVTPRSGVPRTTYLEGEHEHEGQSGTDGSRRGLGHRDWRIDSWRHRGVGDPGRWPHVALVARDLRRGGLGGGLPDAGERGQGDPRVPRGWHRLG